MLPTPPVQYCTYDTHSSANLVQWLPQDLRVLLLPTVLPVFRRRLVLFRESQIFEFVFRHQIPALNISHIFRCSQGYARPYLSIRQVRYDFAKFLHSGSFIPLFSFIHARYFVMTSLHSPIPRYQQSSSPLRPSKVRQSRRKDPYHRDQEESFRAPDCINRLVSDPIFSPSANISSIDLRRRLRIYLPTTR